MSYKAMDWAVKVVGQVNMPPTASLVLIMLAHHHNPTHGCFPSQKALSEALRLPERTVRHNLKLLARAGLIKVRARGRNNRYELCFDWGKSGHPLPPISENIFVNSGNQWPVATGNPLPVTPLKSVNTGNPLPLELTGNSESYFLTGKGKVPDASHSGTKGDPPKGNPESEKNPEPDQNPNPEPENPEAMKVEDAIKAKMTPKSLAEVLKIYSDAKAKKQVVTGGLLARTWKHLHELYRPALKMTLPTKGMMAQLKQAHDLAGEDFVPALAHVIEHWDDFVNFLRNYYDVSFKSFPMVPSVGIVLQYIQPVMQFHQDVKPQSKKGIVIPKVQQAKLPLTKVIAYHASAEAPQDGD